MNTQNRISVLIKGILFTATEHTIWPDGHATGTLADGRTFHVPRWCWRELHPAEPAALGTESERTENIPTASGHAHT